MVAVRRQGCAGRVKPILFYCFMARINNFIRSSHDPFFKEIDLCLGLFDFIFEFRKNYYVQKNIGDWRRRVSGVAFV